MTILCIGSAVVDISAAEIPPEKEWHEKQRVQQIRLLPGGDAVNQAAVLTRMGHRAKLVSAVGADENGRLLRQMLGEQGISTEFLRTDPSTPTGTSLVLVGQGGERHTFSSGGAYGEMTAADLPPLEGVHAVSIASLFQLYALEAEGLLSYLEQAHSRGIPLFADLGSDKRGQGLAGIRRFLPLIDYFLPSLSDALAMTGTESAEEAAAAYRAAGAHAVGIKCAEKGCCLLAEDTCRWIPALSVKPVDTSGAGDCMAAVFLEGILRGLSAEEACRRACSAASESTLYPGASACLPF